MLLGLATTSKGSEIKSQELINKIRKHDYFSYETIQANIYLIHKGFLVQKNENINLYVKYRNVHKTQMFKTCSKSRHNNVVLGFVLVSLLLEMWGEPI